MDNHKITVEFDRNTSSRVFINSKETSWAIFCFTPQGDLFLNSDYGNYFFSWRAFGTCFETFLKGLETGYLVQKLKSSDNVGLGAKHYEVLERLCELFLGILNIKE